MFSKEQFSVKNRQLTMVQNKSLESAAETKSKVCLWSRHGLKLTIEVSHFPSRKLKKKMHFTISICDVALNFLLSLKESSYERMVAERWKGLI